MTAPALNTLTTPARAQSKRMPIKKLNKTISLVGLMGAGKSCIGRNLSAYLDVPFVDADVEIEKAAGTTIADIFEKYGEDEFRRGEREVISRLASGAPCILATGGGAFINPQTRARLQEQTATVWLKADLDVLEKRTAGRTHRPLLNVENPRAVLEHLMAERYPIYEQAHITVQSQDAAPDVTMHALLEALEAHHLLS
jgi:shikimate kinase